MYDLAVDQLKRGETPERVIANVHAEHIESIRIDQIFRIVDKAAYDLYIWTPVDDMALDHAARIVQGKFWDDVRESVSCT